MKHIFYNAIILLCLFGCKDEAKPEVSVEYDSQLFYNGDIITMESDQPEYEEALVEQKGKIVFVGSKAEAELLFKNSELIDLKGKTLLPGFIDPHSHFGMVSNTMGQVNLNPEPVGDVSNIDDMLNRLKAYKEDNKIADGEWIFGWGYDDGQLDEKRHPTKRDIDKVLPDNPVYLQHTSGHMGVANTLALERLDVTAESKNPEGGSIERFPNSKEPTGLVQETAMYPFVGNMFQLLEPKQAEFFDSTQSYYASNGFTTAHDGMTDRNTIAFFQAQADAGKLDIDLIALAGYTELESNLADSTLHFKTYKNGFKVQGTKIVADGSPQGKTAFFTKPFLTEVPGCESDCKGLPSLTQDYLNNLFEMAYKKDNQLFIHCNGDATIDMVIEAHEKACETLNQPLDKNRRTIIIHSQFVRPDQLDTFVMYNLEPSFFTNHAYFWGDEHVKNLGEGRANFLSPMVSADHLGLKPTNHSDATVTPIDPLFTIWTAVNRVSRSGAVIGEAERATPYLAVKAITCNAAYEFFEQDIKGTLTKGKLADLVILDKNPLKVEPMEIKNIQVLETLKEGVVIYQKQK
ncbi:amidohydrolase [Bizionia argentinensis JUB59]|uniref:Amidohydrolase n=1 Tax=Bizionia argentinensis JUB59 TaxID=1046627 RepID=G2ECW2_9FLAO|nr:amidohydrolase [Bizionia argentinensis]EGV43752.1 amidohydrolase [Bizionia argentinensis JUB59]